MPAARSVLAVVHHATAADRLNDVLPLIDSDPRIQVVYSTPPGAYAATGIERVRESGGLELPWDIARRTPFHLAVAAGMGSLADIDAPVLLLEHGAGPGRLVHRAAGHGAAAPLAVVEAHADALVAYGRVIPSIIGIAHEHRKRLLERTVPPAAEAVRLVGDPCFDRMAAHRHLRPHYREALGVGKDELLVVASTTHGPGSLLQCRTGLAAQLAAAGGRSAPAVRTAVVVHPGVTALHGRRQVAAWLRPATRAGAVVVPPESGWRAALLAADAVVGDFGSTTFYAAALGIPVLIAGEPDDRVAPGSHTDLLVRTAPRLGTGTGPELLDTVRAETEQTEDAQDRAEWYVSAMTGAPGRSAALLRAEMYGLAGLPEPEEPPVLDPPEPPPVRFPDAHAATAAPTGGAQ